MSSKKILASFVVALALWGVMAGDRSLAADDAGDGARGRAVIPHDPSWFRAAFVNAPDAAGNSIQEFEYPTVEAAVQYASESVDVGDGTLITP